MPIIKNNGWVLLEKIGLTILQKTKNKYMLLPKKNKKKNYIPTPVLIFFYVILFISIPISLFFLGYTSSEYLDTLVTSNANAEVSSFVERVDTLHKNSKVQDLTFIDQILGESKQERTGTVVNWVLSHMGQKIIFTFLLMVTRRFFGHEFKRDKVKRENINKYNSKKPGAS